MTTIEFDAAVKGITDAVWAAATKRLSTSGTASEVTDQLALMRARLDASDALVASLQKQLAALEQRGVSYKGVWAADLRYEPGSIVTHGGSAWHCNAATVGDRPGASRSWTLMVKRGADGKSST